MIIFYENKKEKGEKKEKKKPTYNSKALCKGDQRIAIAVAGVIRVCCLARQDCHRINISCSTSCKSQNKSKDFHHGGKKPIESPRRKLDMISRYLRHRRHCRISDLIEHRLRKSKGKIQLVMFKVFAISAIVATAAAVDPLAVMQCQSKYASNAGTPCEALNALSKCFTNVS